jgi:Tripartite tricarboxylate transporter family receptor
VRKVHNETSPPKFSATGRRRCRAPGHAALRSGAIVSVAAGAHHRSIRARRHNRARLIGQWLSEQLGQLFVIENRPGASTIIGTEAVVRAPAGMFFLGDVICDVLATSVRTLPANL